jgi:head-tail adaptor
MDNASEYDTPIRIERKVAATGIKSAGKEAWFPVATVAANVQDVLPSRAERVAKTVPIASRPARIRFRYRPDITADMRIVLGRLDLPDSPPPAGRRTLYIVAGPATLGRNERTEVMAAETTTKGGVA